MRRKLKAASRSRHIQMTPEVEAIMRGQLAKFREKFGREPGPEDPVFFDPQSEVPIPLTTERISEMVEAAVQKLPANLRAEGRQLYAQMFELPEKMQ
jgi:hypothetical protein